MIPNSTIVAISTGAGGAISVIRLSGSNVFEICDKFFVPKNGKKLSSSKGFSLHYGNIENKGRVVDDVLVSVFKAPYSYTGENMIEISCHASKYIQQTIIETCLSNGATLAQGGDFTMRAYANGKLDLVQAEAVADLISSSSESAHRLAINQMRGGYSAEFSRLRSELINLMTLMELELDFSEEDVEFADRTRMRNLLCEVEDKVTSLVDSFQQGNAIKNGVPVVIVGKPNVGKSTLLNALLNEDRAMVSPIAGTTRDVIEESITINTVTYRFIDTAGLHQTDDMLENMGIERTLSSVKKASLVLCLLTPEHSIDTLQTQIQDLQLQDWQHLVVIINKSDLSVSGITPAQIKQHLGVDCISISAKNKTGINDLKSLLTSIYALKDTDNEVIISNLRHYDLLRQSKESLSRVLQGIDNNIPTDFIAQDLRETLTKIGELTGEISNDDILHNLFRNFCIGK